MNNKRKNFYWMGGVITILLLGGNGLNGSSSLPDLKEPGKLASLSWMAGSWELANERVRIEEHWIPAKGGLMLGVGRTLRGENAVAFEFLRIEEREDGIYYVAQPNGQPPTAFKLTKWGDKLVEFENPDHDFPQVIRYQMKSDGTLLAQAEGKRGGKMSTLSFPYRPLAKE
jgi:hypothetical protein